MKHSYVESAGLALLLSCSLAVAQPATPVRGGLTTASTQLRIEAQPMSKALAELAAQTGVQLIFSSRDVSKSLNAPAVNGKYSAQAALDVLLANSGLAYEVIDARTIAIRPAQAGENNSGLYPHPASQMRVALDGERDAENSRKEARDDKDAAQVEVKDKRIKPYSDGNVDLPRTMDDAQAYYIYDAATIERSGATDMVDFFRRHVTMNLTRGASRDSITLGNTPDQMSSNNMSRIDLNGMGDQQTLILVNGRPLPGVSLSNFARSAAQPDINGIPLSAVERIEILPASASAIYGGTAVGGVVNIVLRQNYSGTQAKVSYENTYETSAPVRTVSLSSGLMLEDGRTQVNGNFSWSDQDPLRLQDRLNLYRDNRDRAWSRDPSLIPFTVNNPPLGSTPNIAGQSSYIFVNGQFVFDDGALFGPGSSRITHVPEGYAGGGGVAPFLPNAGSFNLELPDSTQGNGLFKGLNSPLGPRAEISGVNLNARRRFTSRLELFTQLSANRNHSFSDFNPGYIDIAVNATAPSNPFGKPVRVVASTLSDLRGFESKSDTTQAVLGMRLSLGGWIGEADVSASRSRFQYGGDSFDSASFQSAVNAGQANVFVDLLAHPIDLAPYAGEVRAQTNNSLLGAAVRAAGPLWELPAGPLTLAGGVRYEEGRSGGGWSEEIYSDRFAASSPASRLKQFNAERTRDNLNGYLELTAPVFSERNARPGLRVLDFQLAGRMDQYKSDTRTFERQPVPGSLEVTEEVPVYGSFTTYRSNNSTLGVRYRPVEALMLRASFGSGFLPPDFNQLQEPFPPLPPELWIIFPGGWLPVSVSDPLRGGQFTQAGAIQGGNPDLEPERSRNRNFGVVFEPGFFSGLRLAVDYSRILKRNNIAVLSAQQIVNSEAVLEGRVTRAAVTPGDPFGVGRIRLIDASTLNLSWSEHISYNVQATYAFASRLGNWQVYASGNSLQHARIKVTDEAPVTENAGEFQQTKFNAAAGGSWQKGSWSAGWHTRYYDAYKLAPAYFLAQGGSEVKSQHFHDAFVAYELPQLPSVSGWKAALAGVTVQVGAKNIFNTKPAFDASNNLGFFSVYGDARMGVYYLSLTKVF